MRRVIKREDLVVGLKITAARGPNKGAKYEVWQVYEPCVNRRYKTYGLRRYANPGGIDNVLLLPQMLTETFHHIRRHYVLLHD